MIKKFIEAMEENTEYGFIANNYNDFSKQDLVNILKEYVYAVLQEGNAKQIKTAIAEELEYYTEEQEKETLPYFGNSFEEWQGLNDSMIEANRI